MSNAKISLIYHITCVRGCETLFGFWRHLETRLFNGIIQAQDSILPSDSFQCLFLSFVIINWRYLNLLTCLLTNLKGGYCLRRVRKIWLDVLSYIGRTASRVVSTRQFLYRLFFGCLSR